MNASTLKTAFLVSDRVGAVCERLNPPPQSKTQSPVNMKAPILKTALLVSVLFLRFSSPIVANLHVDSAFQGEVSGPVNAIVVDADGSILIGGAFRTVNGAERGRVARLNPDGTLRADFGGTGANAVVNAIAMGGNGHAFLGGRFSEFDGTVAPNIATMDDGFRVGDGPAGAVNCLLVDAHGRLILGGTFQSVDGSPSVYVARLTSPGALDSSFVPELGVSMAIEAGICAIAIQPDGKILVGGVFETERGSEYFVRLHPDGSLDEGFGEDHGSILYTKAILPAANRQVLIAGQSRNGTGFVRRLNSDRSIDPTFNARDFNGAVNALAIDRRGRVIVGGRGIARLNADGSLDPSWQLSIGGVINAIALDAGEGVLIGGIFTISGGSYRGLARLIDEAEISTWATNTNVFRSFLQVEAGKNHIVEASSDLRNWSDFDVGTGTADGLLVADPNPADIARRFFRARPVQ
jgi:uncharacterized delta-60 repeat protein